MEDGALTLNSGQRIRISQLNQYGTYDGLLCGLPNERINSHIIVDVLKGPDRLTSNAMPHLIPPKFTTLTDWMLLRYGERIDPTAEELLEHPCLPSIVCLADFTESQNVRCLTVIWFQERFALPIAEDIKVQIKAIDWDVLSAEYSL